MDPGLPASPLSLSAFWPLLLVVVAGGLLVALRWLRGRMPAVPGLRLAVKARVELGGQHVLYVVEAADQVLLLGGAPGGLSLLTTLPAADVPAGLPATRPAEGAALPRPDGRAERAA